jgi:hypothetical protein
MLTVPRFAGPTKSPARGASRATGILSHSDSQVPLCHTYSPAATHVLCNRACVIRPMLNLDVYLYVQHYFTTLQKKNKIFVKKTSKNSSTYKYILSITRLIPELSLTGSSTGYYCPWPSPEARFLSAGRTPCRALPVLCQSLPIRYRQTGSLLHWTGKVIVLQSI